MMPYAEISLVVIRLILASVLLIGGSSKLIGLQRFERTVKTHDVVPVWLARYVAVALIASELTLGSALAFGVKTGAVAIAAACMFVMFAGYLIWQTTRGRQLDCGCFGELHIERITATSGIRTAILGLLLFLVAALQDVSTRLAVDLVGLGIVAVTSLAVMLILQTVTIYERPSVSE